MISALAMAEQESTMEARIHETICQLKSKCQKWRETAHSQLKVQIDAFWDAQKKMGTVDEEKISLAVIERKQTFWEKLDQSPHYNYLTEISDLEKQLAKLRKETADNKNTSKLSERVSQTFKANEQNDNLQGEKSGCAGGSGNRTQTSDAAQVTLEPAASEIQIEEEAAEPSGV